MSTTENPDATYKMMESNGEAKAAIEEVIAHATQEIRIFDTSPVTLQDRDYGRPARIEVLKSLLLKNRASHIRIALHEVTGIEGVVPRLVALLGLHSAQLKIQRTVGAAREAKDVLLIADTAHIWRKPYFDHPRSIQTLNDETAAKPYVDRFEEIWESTEIVPIGGATGL
jgi:hypothetical protein